MIERLVAHPESAPRAGKTSGRPEFSGSRTTFSTVWTTITFSSSPWFITDGSLALDWIGADMPHLDHSEAHPDSERLWNGEIERRCRAIDEGVARLIPADEVFARLLESWIEDGDAQEQRQTGEYLVEALDEDLFPPKLKA